MKLTLYAAGCAAWILCLLGPRTVFCQQEKAPSITEPASISRLAFEQVRRKHRGQYEYPNNLKSNYVLVNGIRLHYVAGGKGSPIVFVHGFGSTWRMWEPALEYFSTTHRVIAIDLPGLGQSGPSTTGYTSVAISAYLFAAIKQLTREPIVYICHDLCNSVSYPMVVANQDYIKKVVFMDSPIPDRAMWTYPGLTPKGPGLGWHFGFFDFGDIAEKLIAHDPKLFFAYFIKSYAGKKNVFTDRVLDELIEPYSRLDNLHAAFSGYYSSHSDDARENEALLAIGMRLRIPSMSLSGAQGVNDVLPNHMRARFVENLADFKAVILPECGHWLLEECSTDVISHLDRFINQ